MTNNSSLFPGRAGELGAAAVKVALGAGVSGNASLLFGRMSSYNGTPFWELRKNLGKLFDVSVRTITRYFRELVDAGLIFNKPAPIGAIPPGCREKLHFRPWYKWPVGLPQLRAAVKLQSKEAYEHWRTKFEAQRDQHVTRSKLGAIIGSIVSSNSTTTANRTTSSTEPRPRRWTREELDAELGKRPVETSPPEPLDSS